MLPSGFRRCAAIHSCADFAGERPRIPIGFWPCAPLLRLSRNASPLSPRCRGEVGLCFITMPPHPSRQKDEGGQVLLLSFAHTDS
uniref:Uncharacterized protein n=1 Tax=Arundo donax TaxID=35708 RepID=A0A0A9EXR1_ARUDO